MWHLSFAAANLVLSVATAVAFSSKLSRGWVKLKRSRAGASADKEVWVQVPLCNQRKPLINFNSWERGILFVWTEDDTKGDVDGCALGMLLGSPSCTSWVYCSFGGLPLAFCPWWAANFLSVSFPNDWRRIFVKKMRKSSLSFCCWLDMGFKHVVLNPEVKRGGFQIWSDEKYRLVIAEPDVTVTSFQYSVTSLAIQSIHCYQSCNTLTDFVCGLFFQVSALDNMRLKYEY